MPTARPESGHKVARRKRAAAERSTKAKKQKNLSVKEYKKLLRVEKCIEAAINKHIRKQKAIAAKKLHKLNIQEKGAKSQERRDKKAKKENNPKADERKSKELKKKERASKKKERASKERAKKRAAAKSAAAAKKAKKERASKKRAALKKVKENRKKRAAARRERGVKRKKRAAKRRFELRAKKTTKIRLEKEGKERATKHHHHHRSMAAKKAAKAKITKRHYGSRMTKNAWALKVFAMVNADEIADYSAKVGILGELLKKMMVKSKHSAVEQYAHIVRGMRKRRVKGLQKYMLRHICKRM
jgi:colicin import membrane protein